MISTPAQFPRTSNLPSTPVFFSAHHHSFSAPLSQREIIPNCVVGVLKMPWCAEITVGVLLIGWCAESKVGHFVFCWCAGTFFLKPFQNQYKYFFSFQKCYIRDQQVHDKKRVINMSEKKVHLYGPLSTCDVTRSGKEYLLVTFVQYEK